MGGGELFLEADASAFVIVDMQNDFLEESGYFGRQGLPVERLRAAIEPIEELRAALPPRVKVVYTVHVYEPDGSDDLARVHRLKPPRLIRAEGVLPVVRGTWGAEVISRLAPKPEDAVIPKKRFDAFYQTDLELRLRCWGVRTLIFGGVVADVCVETTLRSAYVRDFDTVLASDCVAAWNKEGKLRTREAVDGHFGLSLTNSEILSAFGGR